MKVKLYTRFYENIVELEQGGRLNSKEHTHLSEKLLNNRIKDRESLYSAFFCDMPQDKLTTITCVYRLIINRNYSSILSLGAGQCVMEHILKSWLPKSSEVVAADFDRVFVKNAKRYLKGIKAVEYDFFKNKPNELKKNFKKECDMACFFGSSYVMDDEEFIRQFKGLREIGVKSVIDFHTGFIPNREIPRVLFSEFKWIVIDLLKLNKRFRRGICHGYRRTRSELRRLYQKAGYKIVKEISIGINEYVAVLE